MKISIGSDHKGFELKNLIIKTFSKESWLDAGCLSLERCDYPIFAKKVVESILFKKAEFGILICGSGIGMSIAANRFKYIYAGLCLTSQMAMVARADDNLNILVLSSDFVSKDDNLKIVESMLKAWSTNVFKGGRYKERLDMLDSIV